MTERYRVTPRARREVAAYGRVWPAEGCTVTATDVGVLTLQRIEADDRFLVERLDPPPPPDKPTRSRHRRS